MDFLTDLSEPQATRANVTGQKQKANIKKSSRSHRPWETIETECGAQIHVTLALMRREAT